MIEKSPTIRTFSGRQIDLLNPKQEDIILGDIAHHLALCNRYAGATEVPYNVAQHSVIVSYLTTEPFALDGLFHDAPEAYLHDVSSPLKQLLDVYRVIENSMFRQIARKFGCSDLEPLPVKTADKWAFHLERKMLFGVPLEEPWSSMKVPDYMQWMLQSSWPWRTSGEAFLRRYHELNNGRLG